MHSYGNLEWNDGRLYKGEFKDNKFHGKGVYHYRSGKIFDGYFMNGKKHGKGTITFPDQSTY